MSRLYVGVVAGEPSGDVLGAGVLAALRRRYDEVHVEGVGGPLMQEQGLQSLYPLERLSVMGLVEPLKRLPELLRLNRRLAQHFRARPPDIFLGIDSPDFNLRLERRLRRSGIRTAHLVSPSVWAWRSGRVRGILKAVDLMMCLFPFETEIYARRGLRVRHVGHPLADEIPGPVDQATARMRLSLNPDGPLLAILPGSREAEVRLLAPVFLGAAGLLRQAFPRLAVTVSAANRERFGQIEDIVRAAGNLPVQVIEGQTRDVIAAADAVLVASGTATLETALLQRPMVVAYRMGAFSWQLLSRLVKAPHAALPNLLAGRSLVPELLQNDVTPEGLAEALKPLLAGGEMADRQVRAFWELRQQLGHGAAENAVDAIEDLLAGSSPCHG